ncbi:MAG TPA: aldo/keto reductase [Steroidobacteraceae bacterium]|nr:aldo/keto reductase [Steroidobacteraceae bacterium]
MSRDRASDPLRRQLLQAGLIAGLGASLPGRLLQAATPPALITKKIPSTGFALPVIGIGTNSFNLAQQADLTAVLKRFSELGAMLIDTAASYGESEQVIGNALAQLGIRDRVFLATKLTGGPMRMGPPPTGAGGGPGGAGPGGPPGGGPGGAGGPGGPGGPPGGGPPNMGPQVYGKESFDRSLQRLQTDHIDLLQVHNMNGIDTLMPQLQEWKKAGRIRYIGVTTSNDSDHPQMIEVMRKHPLDFVQVDYSIANRDAASTVFPVALERKVAVIANVPFGGRGGTIIAAANQRKLPAWAADFDATNWAQFLLKYVVSHPAVTATISGSTRISHLEENQSAGRGRLPDAAQRKRMEELWDGNA